MKFSHFGFRLMMMICLSIQMSDFVQSSGVLELRMNNFRNPTGRRYDGECCDEFCWSQCDDIFHFGLDQPSGSNTDPKTNYYLTKVTETYENQNDVDFNDVMNGVTNPIRWEFQDWPGSVLFKAFIEDEDKPFTKNDDLDAYIYNLTVTPAKDESSATPTTITISGLRDKEKTTLSLTYKCYCKVNYFGQTCSVECEERDSDDLGHYTCDPNTGAKLCRSGYKNPSGNCKDKA